MSIQDCLIADEKLLQKTSTLSTQPDGRYEIYLESSSLEAHIRTAHEESERENSSFSQVNEPLNKKMIEIVVDIFKRSGCKVFFDLYGGRGNFSFPLLATDSDVRGTLVELSSHLCSSAKILSSKQELTSRLQIVQQKVDLYLKKNSKKIKRSDFVIVDPPRPGLNKEITSHLNDSAALNLFYISCNPAALARDLQQLSSYDLTELWVADLFPQTYHIETLVWLKRSEDSLVLQSALNTEEDWMP